MQNTIQKASTGKPSPAARSVNQIINGLLDGEAMRKRFDDLLGKGHRSLLAAWLHW